MINKKTKILHIGCGNSKKSNSIGVDINKRSAADIIHDLNKFPYPFPKNTFDQIVAENILEHLDDIPKVMTEIHRISKNGAKIIITTGHFSGTDSFTDPTHKHFFTSRTFDYFIPKTALYEYMYSKVKFKKIKVILGPNTKNPILKIVLRLINNHQVFYEKRFAFIFPVGSIYYHLEVNKGK